MESRAELAGFFSQLRSELVTESFDIDSVIIDDRHAVILGRMTDTVRRTGKSFNSRFSLHLMQVDGELVRYHFLEDTAAVRDAAHAP